MQATADQPDATLTLDPMGRWRVQRDMDLIRAICRHVVERADVYPKTVEIEGYEPWIVAHHVDLLLRAGFIDGLPSRELGSPVPSILVRDLTWEGHDFAGALADKTVWGQVKQKLTPIELAAIPIKALAALLGDLAVSAAKAKLGLS